MSLEEKQSFVSNANSNPVEHNFVKMKDIENNFTKSSEFLKPKTVIKEFSLKIPPVIPNHDIINKRILPKRIKYPPSLATIRARHEKKFGKNSVTVLPNGTQIHLMQPRSYKTALGCLESQTISSSKSNEYVNNTQENVTVPAENSNNNEAKNKEDSDCKTQKLLVNVPGKNKQITIIVPQQIYNKLSDSNDQNKKVVTFNEKLSTVYSIVKPTEQQGTNQQDTNQHDTNQHDTNQQDTNQQDTNKKSLEAQHEQPSRQKSPPPSQKKPIKLKHEIIIQKPLPCITKSPQSKSPSAKDLPKIVPQSGKERSLLKKIFIVPKCTITKPIDAPKKEMSIELSDHLESMTLDTSTNNKLVQCESPPTESTNQQQNLSLEMCPNQNDLLKRVKLNDSAQYQNCNANVFESEVGVNQALHQSSTFQEHSFVEGENTLNNFCNVSDNNEPTISCIINTEDMWSTKGSSFTEDLNNEPTISCISNTEDMWSTKGSSFTEDLNNTSTISCISNTDNVWSTKRSNSTESLKKNILLCALEDMKYFNVEDDDGNIPLQKAVLHNDKNTLKRQCIILKLVDLQYLNHQNKNLDTALLLAVKNNHEDFVATLLSYRAKQDIVDKDGNSALHIAVSCHYLVCCKLLLAEEGAQNVINAFNDEGFAPIHLASIRGFQDIVRILVCEGADINKKDAKSGRTAYHHAIVLNQQEVVKVLEGLGCKTGEPDFAGHLPLLGEVLTIDKQRKPKEIVTFSVKNNNSQIKSTIKTNNSQQTSNFYYKCTTQSPTIETMKPESNSIQTKSLKKDNLSSPNTARSKTEISVLSRKRKLRTKSNDFCNVYVVSSDSEESDDDCKILKPKRRTNTSIVLVDKEQEREGNKVLCISDDDCEVVDSELETNIHAVKKSLHLPRDRFTANVSHKYKRMANVLPSSSVVPERSPHSAVWTGPSARKGNFSNDFKGFTHGSVTQAEKRLTVIESVMKNIIINSQVF